MLLHQLAEYLLMFLQSLLQSTSTGAGNGAGMPAWASGWSVDSSIKHHNIPKKPFFDGCFYFGIVFDFFRIFTKQN
jgi:hypothetical protein